MQIYIAYGKKSSIYLQSEATKMDQINEAFEKAEAIAARAEATSRRILLVSWALKEKCGYRTHENISIGVKAATCVINLDPEGGVYSVILLHVVSSASTDHGLQDWAQSLVSMVWESSTEKRKRKIKVSRMWQLLHKQSYYELSEVKGNIRVFCRCILTCPVEVNNGFTTVIAYESSPENETQVICSGSSKKQYKFNHVFKYEDSSEAVLFQTSIVIASVRDEYNVCLVVYGIRPEACVDMDLPMESVNAHPLIIPQALLDSRMVVQNAKKVKQVLVQWRKMSKEESSWECFEEIVVIFLNHNLEDKVIFDGEGIDKVGGYCVESDALAFWHSVIVSRLSSISSFILLIKQDINGVV